MSDDVLKTSNTLRDRIAAAIYRHVLFRAINECECGTSFDGFNGCALDAYSAHVADAVIAELGLRTDRVGTLTRWVTDWLDAPDPVGRLENFLATPIGQSLRADDE